MSRTHVYCESFIKMNEYETDPGPFSSDNMKRSEVEAFIRLHNLSIEDACDLACMTPEEYNQTPPSPQSRISYLPLPHQIREMCDKIRADRDVEPDPDFDLRYDDVDISSL